MNVLYFPKEVLDKAIEESCNDIFHSLTDESQIDDDRLQHMNEKSARNKGKYIKFVVHLSTIPNERVEISIDNEYSIMFLRKEIISKIQLKLKFLKGINSLRITKLKKIGQFENVKIPQEGIVSDHIQEGDQLLCDFECSEIWIKAKMYFDSPGKNIMAECSLKLQLNQKVKNFKKMMQKFIYCIWNKFCAEQDNEVINTTTYVLDGFKFLLDEDTIDAMIQQKEEKKRNPSDYEPSLDSLECQDNDNLNSIQKGIKLTKLKTSFDVIMSMSNIEDTFSDCTWGKDDYQERFDRDFGKIKDYFSNQFEIQKNSTSLISEGDYSYTNFKPTDTTGCLNLIEVRCKFLSLKNEFRRRLNNQIKRSPVQKSGSFLNSGNNLEKTAEEDSHHVDIEMKKELKPRTVKVLDYPNPKPRKTSKDLEISSFDEIVAMTSSQNVNAYQRRGSMSSRRFESRRNQVLPYSLFGNIIVDEQTNWRVMKKNESLLLGDAFFSLPKSSDVTHFVENSLCKSPLDYTPRKSSLADTEEDFKALDCREEQERIKLIDKLIAQYDRSSSESGGTHEEEKVLQPLIELPQELEEKVEEEPKDMYKQYLYEKLVDKPLDGVNCCYNYLEKFYREDMDISSFENTKLMELKHSSLVAHSSGSLHLNDSSKMISIPLHKTRDCSNLEKIRKVIKDNDFQISVLECICQKIGKPEAHFQEMYENRKKSNKQRFSNLFLSLSNIVKLGYHSKTQIEIDKITREILKSIMDHSDNVLRLEDDDFPEEIPQIREFKYQKILAAQEEIIPEDASWFERFRRSISRLSDCICCR
ncbi:unnamed protein product [Moneuplotes crassus]|uniref:Uncharacterized protein n=1 Tax=Euplotes crassus TaxID=5936 RepID=A0AAD2D8A9_EUPCR|nr:unnamed protein product [Moneuplotes crassus]